MKRRELNRALLACSVCCVSGARQVSAQWPVSDRATSSNSGGGWPVADPDQPQPSRSDVPITEPARGLFVGCVSSGLEGSVDDVIDYLRRNMLSTSGNPSLDVLFQQERAVLMQAYGVAPAFAFLNDEDAPNAYATPVSLIPGDGYGTVLYGRALLRDLLDDTLVNPVVYGSTAKWVMAHEFGHMMQYQSGMQAPNVIFMELHADFLAGWYVAAKYVSAGSTFDMSAVRRSVFESGTYNFNHPQFHGTPSQRLAMSDFGMQAGTQTGSPYEAYQLGLEMLGRVVQ